MSAYETWVREQTARRDALDPADVTVKHGTMGDLDCRHCEYQYR